MDPPVWTEVDGKITPNFHELVDEGGAKRGVFPLESSDLTNLGNKPKNSFPWPAESIFLALNLPRETPETNRERSQSIAR